MGRADEVPDAMLLTRAQAGDQDALDALIERYQPRVYRFGMKMCGDPEDARDVLQDTLLAAARSLRTFRQDAALSTWLFTIARNACTRSRRRSRFAPASETSLETLSPPERDQLADPAASPETRAAHRELDDAVHEAMQTLDPMYREVLVLRDVEGLTAPEVARVLGVSVDAVKSRLHRARLAVRAHLAPLVEREPPPAPPSGRCPDILALYSRNLEGDLEPELCARMEAHLDGCGACRGRCESLRRTLALCRDVTAPAVPADVADAVRAAVRDAFGRSS